MRIVPHSNSFSESFTSRMSLDISSDIDVTEFSSVRDDDHPIQILRLGIFELPAGITSDMWVSSDLAQRLQSLALRR